MQQKFLKPNQFQMLHMYIQSEQQMQHYLLSLVNFVTLGSTNYFSISFSSESENMNPVNRSNPEIHTLAKCDLIHISLRYRVWVKADLCFPFSFIWVDELNLIFFCF